MKHIQMRVCTAALLILTLGGCQSFLGIKFARGAADNTPVRVAEPPKTGSQSATEEGRNQLAAGRTGSAILSFQKAMANGEPMAPAANGAGVAFARLGRLDLARRYFEQAISEDQTNKRYAANLARVERTELLFAAAAVRIPEAPAFQPEIRPSHDAGRIERLSRAEVRIVTDLASRADARRTETGKALTPDGGGRMERLSSGEVQITTAQPMRAPTADLEGRFKPLIRISFADK